MLKFLKNLFFSEKPANKLPPLETRGVIARKACELEIISLIHNGGDCYEIRTTGRYTNNSISRVRYGEHRARQCFAATCGMYGAK